MKTSRLILIPALLILIACVSCVSADPVSVSLPAVYMTPDGGEVGVLTNLTVWVTDGTGHVFVDTAPFTQVDMQGSARLASILACDITGIDPDSCDFFYVMHTESPVIGGPSAGAATTVATVAALMNWTVDSGVVMTGMINPDESIGAVGGIPAKLNASVNNGAHTFLVPSGQGNVTVVARFVEPAGPFSRIVEEPVTINVTSLGEAQGVQVVEIEDIRDAIYIYTGHEIPRILLTGEVQTAEYIGAMQPLAAALLEESRAQYNETVAIADPHPQFKKAFVSQNQAMEDAQHDYNTGNYYASMSRSFNTMVNLRRIGWLSGYLAADDMQDRQEYISNLIRCVEDEIADAELDLEDAKSKNAIMEGVGAAESRLTIAREKLKEAEQKENADEAIDLLAFAMERARSARWWTTLSCIGSDATIPDDLRHDRAARYYSQSVSILAYADELVSETDGCKMLIRGAADDLSRARSELQTGYYAGAIYDSLHAMVQAGTAIELIGITDPDEKVNNSKRDAMSAIISARECGAEPILAVSAYEHANILAQSEIDRIVGYGYAKMVARTARSTYSENRTMVQGANISGSIEKIMQTRRGTVNDTKQPEEMPDMSGYSGCGALVVVALVYLVRRRLT
ncbi:MAG: S16 family serine protease [Euryarchaeota archaeon]|nr:S16 family serine protease [Euryarchaeota archaeon]